jgi:methionyl-tRNA formyltransferase
MTLEFVTQDDPLYILPFFEEFFRHYRNEFSVQRVLVSRAMGKRPRRQLLRELLVLYTPLGFLRLGARLILYRCLSALPRTTQAGRFFSLRQLCKVHGVSYEEIEDPNAQEVIDRMRGRRPNVIVSVACPYIFKGALLSVPSQGCVNIHHAPLPRYKGMMPTFWQMLNNEPAVGVTVHYMASKIDEGSALLQETLDIESGESLDSLMRRSKRHGAHCMARVLRQIADGTQRPVVLDQSQGSYFSFPKVEQMREFHRKGLRAI